MTSRTEITSRAEMTSMVETVAIVQVGDPRLRGQVRPVQFPLTDEVRVLVCQLIEAMRQGAGVGIAAPQIGQDLAIIIISSRPTLRYPSAPTMEPLVMFNPTILDRSQVLEQDWEGCLSVPDTRGLVSRSQSVTVRYADDQGQIITQSFMGFVARIIQHECDHLQGILYIDRVASSDHLVTEAQYQQILLEPKA